MTVHALGRINVPTPGTPVLISAVKIDANKIHFEMPTAVSTVVYVCDASGNIIKELQGGAKPADFFDVSTQDGLASLDLAQYSLNVPAGNAGTGAYVTWWEE